jgi:hypothetical protein
VFPGHQIIKRVEKVSKRTRGVQTGDVNIAMGRVCDIFEFVRKKKRAAAAEVSARNKPKKQTYGDVQWLVRI